MRQKRRASIRARKRAPVRAKRQPRFAFHEALYACIAWIMDVLRLVVLYAAIAL